MDETAKTGTATSIAPVGAQLAAAREERGLTVEEIAARTRIPKRSLELIEAGAKEGLPALTYSAGFVRSYADTLGLDGGAMAQRFRAEMGASVRRNVAEPYEPADPARVPTKLLAIVALLLAVVVAGGYAVWRGDGLFGGGAEQREQLAAGTDPSLYPPTGTAPADAPLGGPSAAPAPAASAPPTGPVTVTARQEAWVRIAERDGKTLFMGTMAPGQSFAVPAEASDPVLRTSRPQALEVKVGETAIAPLGEPDTLVRAASLKRDALLASPAAGSSPGPGTAPAPLVPATPTP